MAEHILSLSYGKDSMACLFAIEQLGWPLDRIVTADVWATDTIPADLPPMVEFKAYADEEIKRRWGIKVEHLCAVRNGEKLTYEKLFYHVPKRKTDKPNGGKHRFPVPDRPLVQHLAQSQSHWGARSQSGAGARSSKTGLILGFPMLRGQWCTSDLKRKVFQKLPCTRSEYKYCAVPRHCG